MLRAAATFAADYELVVAGAPGIPADYYSRFVEGHPVRVVYGATYPLLSHAVAALVTSGTATLETALFGVPQVVCYETPLPRLISFLRRHLLRVKYISLVNLIVDRELVPELVADTFSEDNIRHHLSQILPGGSARAAMLEGYREVRERLGKRGAAERAASLIVRLVSGDGKFASLEVKEVKDV